jgi:hypothetical protein
MTVMYMSPVPTELYILRHNELFVFSTCNITKPPKITSSNQKIAASHRHRLLHFNQFANFDC